MSLKKLKLKTEEVEVPGGEKFTVKGLSFTDMTSLYTKYASEVSAFFGLLANGRDKGELDVEGAAILAASFIQKAPALAAEAIAIAAGDDDPEGFAVALSLPMPVQVDALKKIGVCTFGSDGAAKKFAQTVSVLMKNQVSQANP